MIKYTIISYILMLALPAALFASISNRNRLPRIEHLNSTPKLIDRLDDLNRRIKLIDNKYKWINRYFYCDRNHKPTSGQCVHCTYISGSYTTPEPHSKEYNLLFRSHLNSCIIALNNMRSDKEMIILLLIIRNANYCSLSKTG